MFGGCGDVGDVDSGEERSHMDAVSQATRLAIVHDRADPWRTPHRNSVMAVPNGVVVVTWMLCNDSAIHSEKPRGGKPSR